jgi:hypothetical protein
LGSFFGEEEEEEEEKKGKRKCSTIEVFLQFCLQGLVGCKRISLSSPSIYMIMEVLLQEITVHDVVK